MLKLKFKNLKKYQKITIIILKVGLPCYVINLFTIQPYISSITTTIISPNNDVHSLDKFNLIEFFIIPCHQMIEKIFKLISSLSL